MSQKALVWFRQDLRLEDNTALSFAADKNYQIIPLYIVPVNTDEDWGLGGASKWWLHNSLLSLKKDLESCGANLVLEKGEPFKVISTLIKEHGIDAVFWNRCYEPDSIARDKEIKEKLKKQNITVESFNSSLLFEPWETLNKEKNPFKVFTPFFKNCLTLPEPPKPLPKPKKIHSISNVKSLDINSLNLLPEIKWYKGMESLWRPGSKQALKILEKFCENSLDEYLKKRDYPSINGTSLISPYLHFGEIGPRQIWHHIKNLSKAKTPKYLQSYLRQLIWREFAHSLLYHFPHTTNKPLYDKYKKFPWITSKTNLQKWQKGLTGYPIVDAGMKELWHTGWMHNRVRMIVGSFLVKDLLISWNEGAKWFWDTLVDADLANNTLGWQWVGGCGADAAPYFRIFNPILQSEKFDKEGKYIRQWIPELAKLPNKWIHKPWLAPEEILNEAGVKLGTNYPYPIVDHNIARTRALEAFSSLKENNK